MSAAPHLRLAADLGERLQPFAGRLLSVASNAEAQRRLRYLLACLLLLWMAASLLRALWSFVPPMPALSDATVPINPALRGESRAVAAPLAVAALLEGELFGAPGDEPVPETLPEEEEVSLSELTESRAAELLKGIEDGAPESSLPLLLRGVVASTQAGLGQAVIEHRKQQEVYGVGDDLPVGGEVKLAKVMATQVVISNRGRYELLRLFEEDSSIAVAVTPAVSRPGTRGRAVDRAARSGDGRVVNDGDRRRIARAYREQLYSGDPKSISDVVSVAAVRNNGELEGYRINPGRAAQDFAALGFRPGDLVTAVNGMTLTDPANTVRLYQAMRSASEAVFELQRGDEQITLSVSLDASSN